MRSDTTCGRAVNDAHRVVARREPLDESTIVGRREVALRRAEVGREDVAGGVDWTAGHRAVVVVRATARNIRRDVAAVERAGNKQRLAGEVAVLVVKRLTNGWLLQRLQAAGIVLTRQRRVVAH